MTYELEIIICTHNPQTSFLSRTLDALKLQDLALERWRLTVIDNASTDPLIDRLDLDWHPNARVIREDKLGLTNARLRAFDECQTELMVWSDDDNLLSPSYLTTALSFMHENPSIGIAGGKSIPEYQQAPPAWYHEGLAPLGCRDLGDDAIIIEASRYPTIYPASAPIGAGMVSRRESLAAWVDRVKEDPLRQALGRTGQTLTSGEDNDMNLTAMRNGWGLAYVPELTLIHLIPPGRLTLDYQKRIARASFRDFVTVLDLHGIRPWSAIKKWTVYPRMIKSWLTGRVWDGAANAVKWSGAVGQYEGRAKLTSERGKK